MAGLTKVQRAAISHALYNAQRALTYIMDPAVAVTRRKPCTTTTLDYVRTVDRAVLYEVTKEIGSDLCGLQDCVRALSLLLNPEV